MDIQEEVEIVKRELIELIIKHLKENKIAPAKAKQLAKDFLEKLPIQDQKDLLDKLNILGENYEEAKEIYIGEVGKIEKDKTKQTLNQMRQHIQTGNIDEAVNVAKSIKNGGTI